MLENFAELFKTLWVPGSATFFIFGLILTTILVYGGRRLAPWGRRLLLLLTILGYLLSTPLIASGLVQLLSIGYSPLDTDALGQNVDALVILGGGGSTYRLGSYQLDMLSTPSSLRLLEAVRLYDDLAPDWVIVSGGINDRGGVSTPESETMASHLIELGIQADQILIETQSSNTHDQALNIPQMLREHEVDVFVLVTSPTHMRRADLSFQNVSSQHLTSIAPIRSATKAELGWGIFPSAEALQINRDVLRELVGLLYYFLRGWI